MRHLAANIFSLFIALGACLYSTATLADCKPTKCPTSCSSSLSTICDKTFDAGCLVEQNKKTTGGSCFNNVPVGTADSASSVCSSTSGSAEGGTNFPVTTSSDEQVYVKAAAKGTVIFAGITEDGGRTVIIEHTKGCDDSGHGDTGKYHTIYRHLFSYSVSPGDQVEVNSLIGIVGGSTGTENKSVCDNAAQSGKEGFDNSGCGMATATDIHLNFEVVDGPASGSSSSATSPATFNSNCADIQNLCGSCSTDISVCISENPETYHDSTSVATNVIYEDKSGKGKTKAACEAGFKIDPNECLFCGLFKDIFNAASMIAKAANNGLSIPTRNLVGIGFFIWLAIFVLRNVTSFGAIKTGDMLKGIIFQGFRVTVIMLILGGAIYQVMDLTINPILQTGLAFTRTLSATTTCPTEADYLKNIAGYDANKGFQKTSSGGLSIQLGTAFICSIKKIEENVTKIMSYGHYSTCLSFKDFKALGIIPHAGFLTSGLFLYLVGIVLLLMFPWFLIDCLLQLCICVALLPCAIGAFAFKVTSKYFKLLWDFFMNAMFNFVFLSIVIFIIIANFKTWLGYDFNSDNIDPNLFINATGNGLAWWGTTAFRILGICFFCFIFMDEAKGMAEKFAKAPTLGGGKGIGTMFGGLAASTGFSMTKSGVDALGRVSSVLGEDISSATGNENTAMSDNTMATYMNAKSNMRKYEDQNKDAAIDSSENATDTGEFVEHRDKQGNVMSYSKKDYIGDKVFETTYNKNEEGNWVSSISVHDTAKGGDGSETPFPAGGNSVYADKRQTVRSKTTEQPVSGNDSPAEGVTMSSIDTKTRKGERYTDSLGNVVEVDRNYDGNVSRISYTDTDGKISSLYSNELTAPIMQKLQSSPTNLEGIIDDIKKSRIEEQHAAIRRGFEARGQAVPEQFADKNTNKENN